MKIYLYNGATYYIGMNLPWYVSRDMVTSAAEKEGLTNIVWHEREESLPARVDLSKLTVFNPEYEYWVEATYSGPDRIYDLPATPSWAARIRPGQDSAPTSVPVLPPSASATTSQGSSPNTASLLLGIAAIVTGIMVARQGKK